MSGPDVLNDELVAFAQGRRLRANEWTVDPIVDHGDAVALAATASLSMSSGKATTTGPGLPPSATP